MNLSPKDEVLAYHADSTHHPHRYAPSLGFMDWETQPNPFREFEGTSVFPFPLLADRLPTTWGEVLSPGSFSPFPLSFENLGILFELSLGLSAWKVYGDTRWALRCNPSSGNLHPTEGYLLCPDLPGLAGGVYHYQPRQHALEQRISLAVSGLGEGGVLVGLSSIHWREAWKYGLRAFRYCQHDVGHALGALAYAAAALGWQTRLLTQFSEGELQQVMGLDREADFHPHEREEADALLWVGPGIPRVDQPIFSHSFNEGASSTSWRGRAKALSPDHAIWEGIERVSKACFQPEADETEVEGFIAPVENTSPPLEEKASTLIRQRRSAVDFDGVTGMSKETFFDMMEKTLPRASRPPLGLWPFQPRVNLMLFVHRVEGLSSGVYALVRNEKDLPWFKENLKPKFVWERPKECPEGLPLYLLEEGDMRAWARGISCGQDIAADSAFSLGMMGDLGALEAGSWWYKRLHWEAGLIGQSLYLEAEVAGLRGTGIGCFFDEEMHHFLGRKDPRFATLYHFTVGGPVEDSRLRTIGPYEGRSVRKD